MDFDPSSNELSWTIEFSDLSGPATGAHFHGPAEEGANAGVQVNIGEISGLTSPSAGSTELTSEQASMLMDGQMYINIHTEANPNGEIRGQVSCDAATEEPEQETATVTIGDQEYEITYTITGGSLDELTAEPEFNTLLASISSTSDGILTIWLPSEVIDAEDDEFSVFIDGEFGNSPVDELDPADGARVLQIEFEAGAEEIEIVGTSMVGGEEPEPEPETVSVEIDGQEYDIQYEVTGASIQSVSADIPSTSLTVLILSNSSGMLTVWLPTDVIDAETEFTVFVDGEAASVTELDPADGARVLQIEFEAGAEEIEIVGTSIVPEFGPLAILVIAIATIGTILATSRFRRFGGLWN
jgi:hypothetical protein